jgi:ribosomal protein L19E
MPQHKGGKKDRKFHRNQKKCEYYRKVRSVRNKLAKLKRHMAIHPNDNCALAAKAKI